MSSRRCYLRNRMMLLSAAVVTGPVLLLLQLQPTRAGAGPFPSTKHFSKLILDDRIDFDLREYLIIRRRVRENSVLYTIVYVWWSVTCRRHRRCIQASDKQWRWNLEVRVSARYRYIRDPRLELFRLRRLTFLAGPRNCSTVGPPPRRLKYLTHGQRTTPERIFLFI